MPTAHDTLVVLGASMAAFSAASVFLHAKWVVEPLAEYRVPRSWWPLLGAAKAAGAVGLLIGLAVPAIGVIAAVGLVIYFAGAALTVARARWYSHIPFPLMYMAPVVAALALA
jgi:hypothetical protein